MIERVYIEIGNICNLNCSFCSGTKRAPRQMSEREFRLVCQRLVGKTENIYLHVLGEPLMHRELDSFLKIAKEHTLSVSITTNGTLLREKGRILLDSGSVHKVNISLHSQEGSGITDIKGYINDAADFAKECSARGIYTVFRFWNLDSSVGSGKNLENGRIEEYLSEAFPAEWQARRRGYRLDKYIFLEYDELFVWPKESKDAPRERGFCHGLSRQIAILADGTVTPCCLDCDGDIALGNIFEQPIEQILNSKRAKDMLSGFCKGVLKEPLCKCCSYSKRFNIPNLK